MSAIADTMNSGTRVDEREYPVAGSLEEQFRFLLRYVVLAPSAFNTQPWKFRVSVDGIEIFGDYTRRMPVVDPGNRELLMSIGAAIMNLRVAARHFGFECTVLYNYSGGSEEPLAFAGLVPGLSAPRDAEEQPWEALFAAIPRRHTNRKEFMMSRVPAAVTDRLRATGHWHDASLIISADGSVNERIAELVAGADRIRMADPEYRRGIAEWLRPSVEGTHDGIPGESIGLDTRMSAINSWATTVIDLGKIRSAHDKNLCLSAPGLIAVCGSDTAPSWLAAGELLERMLLLLTHEGLYTSYFNMPVQVPDIRMALRTILGTPDLPHVLLRIGYALHEPVLTPRRSIDEVMLPARSR